MFQVLVTEYQRKLLEKKLNIFGEIMYSHCMREFGGNKRMEVFSPQNTWRHRRTKVLRAWKNGAQKRFTAADGREKKRA